jgi:branched-chain amino acid transport system substrate-binding protein
VRRTLIALLTALGLLLAACGGSGGGEGAADEPTAQGGGGSGGEAGATGGETSASGGGGDFDAGTDVIKIGLVNPYSGPFGFFGTFVENSVQVEVDRINEAGGLGGAMLEIDRRDMELNPQLAVQGAQEFIGDDAVKLVIGPPFTGFYNATKQLYEDAQQLNCSMAVAGPEAIEGLTYAFRTQDPDQFRTAALMDYLAEEEGVESIAIVYEDDDTGQGYAEVIPQLAEERGMEYLGFQATRPDAQTHRPQVEAVRDADAIIISGNSTNAAKTAKAAEEIGYEGLLTGFSGLQGFTYVEGAGDAADGTVFASNYLGYFTEDPPEEWPEAYRDHVQTVLERYGETTGPTSGVKQYNGTALAADCVFLFEQAVRAAGSLEPDAVVEAWEGLEFSRDETPSAVEAAFGPDDHEEYGAEDLYIYRWTKAGDGWKLEELASAEG